jgi:hypothetical protein
VQDTLAAANGRQTIFEPLHPDAVEGARPFANLFVKPSSEQAALKDFMGPILDGRINSLWAKYRVRPDRLIPPIQDLMTKKGVVRVKNNFTRLLRRMRSNNSVRGRPLAIKFIRANLMIEWILREYNLKAALVVRHPCAVLSSVIRRGGAEWGHEGTRRLLNTYLGQPDLINDRLHNIKDSLLQLDSFAALQAAVWCIENAHLIKEEKRLPLMLVHYEHLISKGETCWHELASQLELENVPSNELLTKPSQQADHRMRNTAFGQDQLGRWLSHLTNQQQAEVQQVLELFDVRRYNAFDTMPLIESY